MNLLEYQSKNFLSKAGITVPAGMVIDGRMDVGVVLSCLGLSEGVVKAQVPAGGRGMSGGVIFVNSVSEAEVAAATLIGSRLVTSQTGPEGLVVKKVLLEEAIKAEKEYYLAITIDRSTSTYMLLFSPEGGKAVEDMARLRPEKVYKEPIDPFLGPSLAKVMEMARSSGLAEEAGQGLSNVIEVVFELFVKLDALLIEINPLAFTGGRFIALDAKIAIDDNAIFRHPELSSFREEGEPLEQEAREAGISYIALDGDVGCLVNGAGLAMATMDMIRLAGRKPANFLDIGGNAHHEQFSAAIRLLLSDPRVKDVFVNIFGGIVHCNLIATEIVEAVRDMRPVVPIIVRLEGTDAKRGREIIEASRLPIVLVSDMEDGMEKIGIWESS